MSTEESYSINAAAKLTGYSLPTLRKRLPALKKAGAVQRDGRWSIPLSALHAVGLMSRVEADSKPVISKVTQQHLHSETINELDELRAQNRQLSERVAVAEALAAERADMIAILKPLALERSQQQPERPRFKLFSRH